MVTPLTETAPAKVNLTLRVIGRRPDGYHELESLVAFARVGDRLDFVPGEKLALEVTGPFAAGAGSPAVTSCSRRRANLCAARPI